MFWFLLACVAPGDDSSGAGTPGDSAPDTIIGNGPWAFTATKPPVHEGWTWPTWNARGIVYLNVDTLRADHLPAYGYTRETTPNLSAEPWIQVDGIEASASWTVPSTASLLSATPPWIHQMTAVDDAGTDYVEIAVPTVAEHLAGLGWATGVFTGNEWIGADSELVNGFQTAEFRHKSNVEHNLTELIDPMFEWLDSLPADQPFFLHIQPMDMHSAYWVAPEDRGYWGEGDPPFDIESGDQDLQNTQIALALRGDEATATQALNDVYDEQLIGLDRGFGLLREGLVARGLWDDSMFVFSGDHGETLNDDGEGNVGHARWLRQELVRNPFLVRPPDGVAASVTCLAENARLFPTLLDRMGLPSLPTATAGSLTEGCDAVAVSTIWATNTTIETLSATNGAERLDRYCLEGREVGWDLAADPGQLVPLSADQLSGVDALRTRLDGTLDEIRAVWPDGNTCTIGA